MVCLDGRRAGRPRLDYVRVQRALHQIAGVADRADRLLEDTDERLADDPPLLLRIGDTGQQLEEAILRLDMDEIDLEMRAKGLLDLLRLPCSEQPVVDEDTGQPIADRLVD